MKKIKEICDKNNCTGCGLCKNICPKGCIKMDYDNDGFLVPFVEDKECINCNLCKNICPSNENMIHKLSSPIKCLKVYSLDKKLKINSTSGGIFSTFAKIVIENGGIVFGSTFDREMNVRHIMINSFKDIDKISGSKYIGSNIDDNYFKVKQILEEGKKVLFSGTPCQVYALKKFLGREYDNLITCDFVCHGIGSTKVFKLFIENIQDIYKSKVKSIYFRNKDKKYINSKMKIELDSGKTVYFPSYKNSFGYPFSTGMINRKSCYSCNFAQIDRCSDFTMADCIKDLDRIQKREGCSLLLINSNKAIEFFENNCNRFKYNQVEMKYVQSIQEHLNKPQNEHIKRDEIFEKLDTESFRNIEKKYFIIKKENFMKRAFRRIRRIYIK